MHAILSHLEPFYGALWLILTRLSSVLIALVLWLSGGCLFHRHMFSMRISAPRVIGVTHSHNATRIHIANTAHCWRDKWLDWGVLEVILIIDLLTAFCLIGGFWMVMWVCEYIFLVNFGNICILIELVSMIFCGFL